MLSRREYLEQLAHERAKQTERSINMFKAALQMSKQATIAFPYIHNRYGDVIYRIKLTKRGTCHYCDKPTAARIHPSGLTYGYCINICIDHGVEFGVLKPEATQVELF